MICVKISTWYYPGLHLSFWYSVKIPYLKTLMQELLGYLHLIMPSPQGFHFVACLEIVAPNLLLVAIGPGRLAYLETFNACYSCVSC